MPAETLANRTLRSRTSKQLASHVGFCVIDGNADLIAGALLAQIHEYASMIERRMNRLFRGREAYTLSDGERALLTKLAGQFAYLDRTADQILEAQEPLDVQYQQAAE